MQKKISDIDIDKLWLSFKNNPNTTDKQNLIIYYINLIKFTINKMVLPVNSIMDEDDFTNFGVIGLSEAIDRFEPERGFKFESYAVRRIKGKIQDEMRKLDWLSRTARKKVSEFKNISENIQIQQDKGTSEIEVLKELNISPEKYRSYLLAASDAKSSIPISDSSLKNLNESDDELSFIEEIADESQNFLDDILENEKISLLTNLISELKENKRSVLTLYYFENLNFKEIGQVLGVSESRISQIHSETIKDLKQKMNRYEYV